MKTIIAVLLVVVGSVAAATPKAGAQLQELPMTQDAPVLSFEDQFDQRHQAAALRGDVVVLLLLLASSPTRFPTCRGVTAILSLPICHPTQRP